MSKVFIIAEAGSNWRHGPANADLDHIRALAMIRTAADCGADAVKFQVWSSAPVYAPDAGWPEYLAGRDGSINDLFNDLALPTAWLPDLTTECIKLGIEFMASVFSPADVAVVDPFVKRHKIASYEIGYEELIRAAASTGKPLILSTGAATQEEVAWAVERARRRYGVKSVTVMHCVAAYPAPVEQTNLRVIARWSTGRVENYRADVGLSDHTIDPILCPIAAVALGATMIEKHFTLGRNLDGPDHAFALEPNELAAMVRAVRQIESALGNRNKTVQPCEEPLRQFASRAVQAVRDIQPGETIVAIGLNANVAVLRPGNRRRGANAQFLSRMVGQTIDRFIRAGDGV